MNGITLSLIKKKRSKNGRFTMYISQFLKNVYFIAKCKIKEKSCANMLRELRKVYKRKEEQKGNGNEQCARI